MIRRIALIVILLVVGLPLVAVGLFYAAGAGLLGQTHDAGEIVPLPRPQSEVAQRIAYQQQAGAALAVEEQKQVLFGDFHVHTTFSTDAFLIALPMLQGEGAHPPADACDFARYCSALDFWALTDHAESLTPFHWEESRRSVRECDAAAGEDNKDLVSFLGWEWTQVGTNTKNHYGHKNVILLDIENDKTPARPIYAAPPETDNAAARVLSDGPSITTHAWLALGAPGGNRSLYLDYARYSADQRARVECPPGTDPQTPGCIEGARTPRELFSKLRAWDYPSIVIPHGTTWGFYTPPGSSLDKQLGTAEDDPEMQTLFEIYSGHGNSEEYRPWRAVKFDANGRAFCPEPSDEYLPTCHQAGVILERNCLADGENASTCSARAAEARQAVAERGIAGWLAIGGAQAQDWLDSGQCRDCFLPAFNYRPAGAGQYALALTNFSASASRRNFRFGFMGSSDIHQARGGTGYKEFARHHMAEVVGPPEPGMPIDLNANRRVPSAQVLDEAAAQEGLAGFQLLEGERAGSFFTTGGLIAVHASARERGAIWQAMEQRETYATSGDRILLWFDLNNGPEGKVPMGGEAVMNRAPQFTVRAAGSFEQEAGCPDYVEAQLGKEKLESLCLGECYNPSGTRKNIAKIEIIRILPQQRPDEPIEALIQDPWRSFECNSPTCQFSFSDTDFVSSGRQAVYYARVVQEESLAVNGGNLRCEYDANGACIKINPCFGDYRTPTADDCLAPVRERAWSSPIYLDVARNNR